MIVQVLLALLVALVLVAPAWAQAASNRLTWTDNATNETGTKVYRKIVATPGTPGGLPGACADATPYALLATTAANLTTYVDAGVQENVTFCYVVTAFNTAGESAPSNAAGRTVPFSIPVPHSGLGVSAGP